MSRFQMVNQDGTIKQTVDLSDDSQAAANTPSGTTAVRSDLTVSGATHTYDFTKKAFVVIPPSVVTPAAKESTLLTQVDTIREGTQMAKLTSGGAKKMAYNAKQLELANYMALLPATLANLSATSAAQQFPYATKESQLSGDTLAIVMARWKAAQLTVNTEVQRVEAIAVVGKAKIRAATTVAAKQAAYDAINWNWGK